MTAGRARATADKIVIATGTRPARPASVDFDERTVIDSDGIVHLKRCRGPWSSRAPG